VATRRTPFYLILTGSASRAGAFGRLVHRVVRLAVRTEAAGHVASYTDLELTTAIDKHRALWLRRPVPVPLTLSTRIVLSTGLRPGWGRFCCPPLPDNDDARPTGGGRRRARLRDLYPQQRCAHAPSPSMRADGAVRSASNCCCG